MGSPNTVFCQGYAKSSATADAENRASASIPQVNRDTWQEAGLALGAPPCGVTVQCPSRNMGEGDMEMEMDGKNRWAPGKTGGRKRNGSAMEGGPGTEWNDVLLLSVWRSNGLMQTAPPVPRSDPCGRRIQLFSVERAARASGGRPRA